MDGSLMCVLMTDIYCLFSFDVAKWNLKIEVQGIPWIIVCFIYKLHSDGSIWMENWADSVPSVYEVYITLIIPTSFGSLECR